MPADRIRLVPNGIDADRFRFDARRRAEVRGALEIPEDAFVAGGSAGWCRASGSTC